MVEDKPVLIIIAGPNGSGKTSVTGKILQHEWTENCLYINPDEIAQSRYGDWNSQPAIQKAADYAENLRENCLKTRQSLIFETVLSIPEKINYIQRAKSAGYFIRFFFVGTDSPAINASRITRRVMEGGHSVPIDKIISRYSKSIANSCIAAMIADRAYFYDNSVDFADPKLLFRTNNGNIKKVYQQINDWAKEIFDFITE